MAVRKEKVLEQVAAAVARDRPGDPPVVTVHAVSGPSPLWMPLLGFFLLFRVKYYFLTVTQQGVVIHRVVKLTGRPAEAVVSLPQEHVRPLISQVQYGTPWNNFRLHFPGERRPTRLNVARVWRPELEQLLHVMGVVPAPH